MCALAQATWLKKRPKGEPLRIIGAHDAVMAILATKMRADGLWLGSLSVSLSLGLPDEGVVTTDDYARRVTAIRRVSSLPILVDVDAGCIAKTPIADVVAILSAAGADGIAIEDKLHPKANSFVAGVHRLMRLEDYSRLLMTAHASRPSNTFAIIARSDALVAGLSPTEALERLAAYEDYRVDGLLVQSTDPEPRSLLKLLEDLSDSRTVVGVIPTAYPQIAAATWGNSGASVIVYANQLLRASIPAMIAAASAILEDQGNMIEESIATVEDLLSMIQA